MKSWNDPTWGNPEGFCPKCECYTTQITLLGDCRECGTEVVYEDEIQVAPVWEQEEVV